MNGHLKIMYLMSLLPFLIYPSLRASDWQETNLQYLHGNRYLTPTNEKFSQSIITVEHVSGWTYGTNFFFFDIASPDTHNDTKYYGEISPAISLEKIELLKLNDPFIKDILLQLNLELPQGPVHRTVLEGVTLEWKNLWFDYLSTQFLRRDILGVNGTSAQLTLVWSKVFGQKKWPIRFNGFLDWASKEGEVHDNLQTQPSLLLDFALKTDGRVPLRIGIEYNYWHNKLGIKGLNQSVPQLKIVWIF